VGRRGWFSGETFFSIKLLNSMDAAWCLAVPSVLVAFLFFITGFWKHVFFIHSSPQAAFPSTG
jgi:hypothetical protein